MTFQLWSDSNVSVKEILRPDLGIRNWNELEDEEKPIIFKNFSNRGWFKADGDMYEAVSAFGGNNKARNFCHHLLDHGGPHYLGLRREYETYPQQCCLDEAFNDFKEIFIKEEQGIVYELLSYLAKGINSKADKNQIARFIRCFNDISDQFGLNVLLSADGLIPRQEQRITENIYKPVIKILADKKWVKVSEELGDAFSDYQKNTPSSYSSCITHAMSGLQGFLQITVYGKTGKGNFVNLIQQAITKSLIPNDSFSKQIFTNIQSVLMQERQDKGDPHPKKEYANEKSARLVLNLIMVFIQHCLQ